MSEHIEPQLPPSQFEQELTLVDKYKGSALETSFNFNMDAIRRFAGFGIPQFGLVQPKEEYPDDPEFSEDIGSGFVAFGMTQGSGDFVGMILGPQISDDELPTPEEFDVLSKAEQHRHVKGQYGEVVIGDQLPKETKGMLDDILNLLDAEAVKEEPEDRIWIGAYKNTDMYVRVYNQEHVSFDGYGNEVERYTVHAGMILGHKAGALAVNEFSRADLGRIQAAGESASDLRRLGVDRSTLDGYLKNIEEINGGSET